MSGLDDLLAKVPDASYALDELTGTQAYEWALSDVRKALLAELDRLEAVTTKQVEEYPTDPKVWTAYRDALGDVRRWAGDGQ